MFMKYTRLFYFTFLIIFLSACGGSNSEPEKETVFYKKENVTPRKLELSNPIQLCNLLALPKY